MKVVVVILLTSSYLSGALCTPSNVGSVSSGLRSSGVGPGIENGLCECSVFEQPTAKEGQAPLVAQSPGVRVTCTDDGAQTCHDLCSALAQAARAKGPEILCSIVKHANMLTVSVFTRICKRPWTYTGITATEPICCHDGTPKLCPSAPPEIVETTSAVIISSTDAASVDNMTVVNS